MTTIEQIESDQILRFNKRRINMYKIIKDKPTRKQIKYIGDKLKFMFKNDVYGKLSADIQVFHLVFNSPLTLDIIQHQVLTNGQKSAQKGLTIEQFLEVVNKEYLELNLKNEISQEEKQKIVDEYAKPK